MDGSLPRVLSVETRPCENCGKELAVNTWGDGSTSVVACDTCWPPSQTASLVEAPAPRETGTNVEAPVVDASEAAPDVQG